MSDDDVAVRIDRVSKKYCKSLRRSMLYGMQDICRNMIGMGTRSDRTRKQEFWALDDVSFEIRRGETLGLIGPNGSGKTTLLKLVNGIFWPDKGTVAVRGTVGALIAVGAGFHPLLSGRENIYINGAILGMSKAQLDERFDAIVDFADIGDFLDTPVKHYSSGMYVRLGFAVAVHADPDIMLVDEVLAVGDRGFQTKCFKRMGELREQGTTFILVSHNMHTISTFVDRVALLDKGKITEYETAAEGIRAYTKLFITEGSLDIEKLTSGHGDIRFFDVEIPRRELAPGDSFVVEMQYEAERRHEDVEIDIAIYHGQDAGLFYQATNQAYQKQIDLRPGTHGLAITIEDIPICDSMATMVIAIWSRQRTEQLFWWRIPVQFAGVDFSTGKTFLPVRYQIAD